VADQKKLRVGAKDFLPNSAKKYFAKVLIFLIFQNKIKKISIFAFFYSLYWSGEMLFI
jgi:phage terminase small subunit